MSTRKLTPAGRRANELDGKTWARHSISVWSDIRKSPEELRLGHPAVFPQELVRRLVQCFTTQDDRLVLDPFSGVGSTALAAAALGKLGIGLEISQEFTTLAKERAAAADAKAAEFHTDDARNLLRYVKPGTADLVITSPPYWDILLQRRTADYKERRHYGDAQGDLGKVPGYEDFLSALRQVFEQVAIALGPGKYCCVVVMDVRKKNRFYPLHADVAAMMQGLGFLFDDVIIWDRRHEYNNLRPLGYPYRFRINKVHEFILIFQKPLA